MERALIGGHCVRRLIRGHRVCPAGRLIRSLTDEGRGFDSHIVHTLKIFFFIFWEVGGVGGLYYEYFAGFGLLSVSLFPMYTSYE